MTQLEALRDDVTAQRLTPEVAARAAFEVLRPIQRAAVAGRAPGTAPHH